MNYTRIYLCAVPKIYWDQSINNLDIAIFAADALGCERLITKGVNLENECRRYTLLCQRMEESIMQSDRAKFVYDFEEFQYSVNSGNFPMQAAKPGYLPMLSRSFDSTRYERLGSSFFTPMQVGPHRRAFLNWTSQQGLAHLDVVKHRLRFLEWAERLECGIVELQSGFFRSGTKYRNLISTYAALVNIRDEKEEDIYSLESPTSQGVKALSQTRGMASLANLLREQIKNSLQSKEPLIINRGVPYQALSEVLNEFVFINPGEATQASELRIVYSDGTEALPFPVFCLPRIAGAVGLNQSNKIRVALISNRNLEIDPLIDMSWFRNSEVANSRTISETDKFCFDATIQQLHHHQLLGIQSIDIYLTGLIPAVIGFYRGVVQLMLNFQKRNIPRSFSITPFYYRGDSKFQAGSIWQ